MASQYPIGFRYGTNPITLDTTGVSGLGEVSAVSAISVHSSSVSATTFSSVAISAVSSTVSSTFIPPRMTTTQRNAISAPPAGSVIYNTTTNLLNHYNGSAWLAVGAATVGVSQTITINDADGFTTHELVFTDGIITGYS